MDPKMMIRPSNRPSSNLNQSQISNALAANYADSLKNQVNRRLGDTKKMSFMEKILYALSYPKFQTSLYNVNGQNVFTSRFTIVAFSLVMLIFFFY